MDTISIETSTNLYWLGRYVERFRTILNYFAETVDIMIDKNEKEYIIFCEKFGIPNNYKDKDDFIHNFLFDENNSYSMISTLNNAYQNAMFSKDIISSECYSYLRIALNNFKNIKIENLYLLKEVTDNIFGFWGSCQEYIENSNAYNFILMGKYIEKIDIFLRIQGKNHKIKELLERLKFYTNKYSINLNYEECNIDSINNLYNSYFLL